MLFPNTIRPEAHNPSLRDLRGTLTILLVDDDPLVLAVLKAVLTHHGYNVVSARDPLKALKTAQHTAFDILITDFQMPGMNGFALAKRLVAQRPFLPVLLISGSAADELPLCEIRENQWNFLSKPIDRALLLRIIDDYCLGRSTRPRT